MSRERVIDTESGTTIAHSIDAMSDKEKLDAACKRILSDKQILARIMKACLSEYKDCDADVIATKYIEGNPKVASIPVMPDEDAPGLIEGMDTEDKSLRENVTTYDVRFYALAPGEGKQLIRLIINVEAQNDFTPGYPLTKRGIYYICRMISSQRGRVFQNSEYQKMEKVVSIWICMNPPQYRGNTITRYYLVEENLVGDVKEDVQNYDLLTLVFICLGGPEADNYDGILRMLDVLFSSRNSVPQKKQILQDDYGIKMTQTLEREVSELSGLWIGVEQRGMEKGRAEGRAEGRTEGIIESTLRSIKNLMDSMGWPADQAMTALQIAETERPQYLKLLTQ